MKSRDCLKKLIEKAYHLDDKVKLFSHFIWTFEDPCRHIFNVLKIMPHCDINSPPLATHLQMTSECYHLLLNSVKAIICFLSGVLSHRGQTSGEKQMAALRVSPVTNCFFARGNFLRAAPIRKFENREEVFKKN